MSFYILRRNKTYYYRIKIPLDLKQYIPYQEIKRSLRTTDLKAAKIIAATWHRKTQNTFALIRSEALPQDQIQSLIAQIFPHSAKPVEIKLKLSDLFSAYIKERTPHWSSKTRTEYISHYSLLSRILGDRDVNSYQRSDFTTCRDTLVKMPTNLKKKKEFKGLTIHEIIKTSGRKMHAKTVNKHLILLSSSFKWAIRNEYTTSNFAEGLLLPITNKADEERKPYNSTEIAKIISNLPNKTSEPEKFWIPIIALYSGLRLDEICQLHTNDIYAIGDIYCIDVNDDGIKKLKTASSRRIIPMHQTLIDMGLLDYCKDRKQLKGLQLWRNLKRNKYGYWGKNFSNWYSRFNRKIITQDERNSFRHTVANALKQLETQETMISEILGHANNNISTGRYGKKYKPERLHTALNRIKY